MGNCMARYMDHDGDTVLEIQKEKPVSLTSKVKALHNSPLETFLE